MNNDPYETPESNVYVSSDIKKGMFSNIFDYGYKRSTRQAFGFYLVHFISIMLLGGIISGIYASLTGKGGFEVGLIIGSIMAIVLCITISTTIVIKKRIMSFKNVTLILASGVLAIFIGGLGGLLPAAYLTTLDENT